MKKFKFEITITEQDVEGDEFWEQAIERDYITWKEFRKIHKF